MSHFSFYEEDKKEKKKNYGYLTLIIIHFKVNLSKNNTSVFIKYLIDINYLDHQRNEHSMGVYIYRVVLWYSLFILGT